MKEVKGYEEENKKIQHISNWSQKRREKLVGEQGATENWVL